MIRTVRFVIAVVLAACTADDPPPAPASLPSTTACNGADALCARRYDEVTYLVTHNGMSNADEPWIAPNQDHPIRRQLTDGVRGLSIDVHENPQSEADPLTCHGTCMAGSRLLVFLFDDVRTFLEAHPREVVTILYESVGVPDAEVGRTLQKAGLDRYIYTQATDATWPTLGELIAANKRLVVFTQETPGAPGLIMPMWAYLWDNPYEAESTAEFSCAEGRGQAHAERIMSLNHFITAPLGGEYWAAQANTYAVLQEHVARCHAQWKQWPTFLWVDWYATGDALAYVKDLNEKDR
jgi:hypothetical protein